MQTTLALEDHCALMFAVLDNIHATRTKITKMEIFVDFVKEIVIEIQMVAELL